MSMMKAIHHGVIYLFAFLTVGWILGYSPIETGKILAVSCYDPGANHFKSHPLPLNQWIRPALFFSFIYGFGILISCGIENSKRPFTFEAFQKNIFIGLLCIGTLLVMVQLKGHAMFLARYIQVSVRQGIIRERLGQSLDFAVTLADHVHRRYSGQPVTVGVDMGPDCGEDPCFYIERALKYYLYPIDTGDIRGEAAVETLKPLSR